VLAQLLVAAGLFSAPVLAQTAGPVATPPPVAAAQLPTGGQVKAGQATISQSGNTLNVNQTSQRAVVDWNTFNLSKDATVNFQQPNAQASTLNRVADTQPSQILGRITAPGQVILVNPQGVYFGKSASVDVGGLVATTHDAVNREFMEGQIKLSRNGATGRVENEGELRAALGGYIAMLAPEVRNNGVIVANLGTVALAAGESFELKFDGNGALSNVRVSAASINTLIENKSAIKAPGGFIILSAQAASRLQTAVINNSGSIEAVGMARRAGRISLEATGAIFNSGSINANASGGADGGPVGTVNLNAPEVQNSGTISAANFFPEIGKTAAEAGRISIQAENFTQTSSGLLDVSAVATQSGLVDIVAAQAMALSGRVFANGVISDPAHIVADALGGSIQLQATRRIDFTTAVLDASGEGGGGRIHLQADGEPAPANNPGQPSRGAILLSTNTVLRASSSRAQAGRVEVAGDEVTLSSGTKLEAKGATAGGTLIAQASKRIDVSDITFDASGHTDGGYVSAKAGTRTVSGTVSLGDNTLLRANGVVQSGGRIEVDYDTLSQSNSVTMEVNGAIRQGVSTLLSNWQFF
jgi:filamentous hemagglutinin family protein